MASGLDCPAFSAVALPSTTATSTLAERHELRRVLADVGADDVPLDGSARRTRDFGPHLSAVDQAVAMGHRLILPGRASRVAMDPGSAEYCSRVASRSAASGERPLMPRRERPDRLASHGVGSFGSTASSRAAAARR